MYNIISIEYIIFLVFLVAAAVDAKRVIRAAPTADKTGKFIVKLEDTTSHENFEQLAKEIQHQSDDQRLHGRVEGTISNIISARLSDYALSKVHV